MTGGWGERSGRGVEPPAAPGAPNLPGCARCWGVRAGGGVPLGTPGGTWGRGARGAARPPGCTSPPGAGAWKVSAARGHVRPSVRPSVEARVRGWQRAPPRASQLGCRWQWRSRSTAVQQGSWAPRCGRTEPAGSAAPPGVPGGSLSLSLFPPPSLSLPSFPFSACCSLPAPRARVIPFWMAIRIPVKAN